MKAWSDEDGNYWAEGHIAPEQFVELCREHDRECGIDSTEEGVDDGGLNPAHITHSWWRQCPDDDEVMHRSSPNHAGAAPFTEWRR